MKTQYRSPLRMLMLLPMVLLAACATNRSQISLTVPPHAATASVGDERLAVIITVADQRMFEERPRDPSIPSLKRGDRHALDSEGRKAAVGRKRNSYGKALGDIVLRPPQTVETITRQLLQTGLTGLGYRVLDAAAPAPEGALVIDVGIEEFWAWFTPGFWAVSMEARMKTVLTLRGAAGGSAIVTGYGTKSAQTGREGNYIQAYERAFENYLESLPAALREAGL
jgi:uncharacterized lipoprotein YajG